MNIGWILVIIVVIIMIAVLLFSGRRRPSALDQQALGQTANLPTSQERLNQLDAQLTSRDRLIQLIRQGQKINAIKLYREETGASLREAKMAVERMELSLKSGNFDLEDVADLEGQWTTAEDVPLNPALVTELHGLLLNGNRLEAIKRYREATGAPLREALAVIKGMEAAMRYQS